MRNILFTVALLLFSGLAYNAAAGDGLEETSKAGKLQHYLEAVGVNNPKILQLTEQVKSRMEGKYLRLAEERFPKGDRVVLHYAAKPKISAKQLELKFQPANSRSEVVMTTKSVTYQYKFSF